MQLSRKVFYPREIHLYPVLISELGLETSSLKKRNFFFQNKPISCQNKNPAGNAGKLVNPGNMERKIKIKVKKQK
jgi:hypothetical protein